MILEILSNNHEILTEQNNLYLNKLSILLNDKSSFTQVISLNLHH